MKRSYDLRKRFFFSSRRQHTKSTRDWSSDLCSSDLSPRGDTDELVKGDPPIHQRIRGRSPRDADRHRRARILRAAIHRQGIERLPSVDAVASKAHSLRTTIGQRRRVMNVGVLLAGWPFATLLVLYVQYPGHAPLCGVVRGKTIGAKPWSWREMGRPTRYRL